MAACLIWGFGKSWIWSQLGPSLATSHQIPGAVIAPWGAQGPARAGLLCPGHLPGLAEPKGALLLLKRAWAAWAAGEKRGRCSLGKPLLGMTDGALGRAPGSTGSRRGGSGLWLLCPAPGPCPGRGSPTLSNVEPSSSTRALNTPRLSAPLANAAVILGCAS